MSIMALLLYTLSFLKSVNFCSIVFSLKSLLFNNKYEQKLHSTTQFLDVTE